MYVRERSERVYVREKVKVYVCKREKERMCFHCMFVYECLSLCVCMCMRVSMCVCEKERYRQRDGVCDREKWCVRERERKRERDRVHDWMYVMTKINNCYEPGVPTDF